MTAIRQLSFSAGEISPSLYTRVDTSRYQTGLKTLRNHIVLRSGGSQNRAGTEFVGQVRYGLPQDLTDSFVYSNTFNSSKVRLVPFIFNDDQTYVLELGAFYMSVIKNGEYITDNNTVTVSSVSSSINALVTQTAHGYSEFDVIGFIDPPFEELRGRTFYVTDVTTNTYTLRYLDGTYVDSRNFTATSGSDSTYWVFTLATPYSADELQEIQFVQSADVVTIVHHAHAPAELARLAADEWTFTNISFTPTILAPANVTNDVGGSGGGNGRQWAVTTIALETFEESLRSPGTQASAPASAGAPVTISWDAAVDAQSYNVYKVSNGIYGFIGAANGTSFVDSGKTADTTVTPPEERNPFASNSIQNITLLSPFVSIPLGGGGLSKRRVQVTCPSHGYVNGDMVYIYNLEQPNHLLGNKFYLVADSLTDTFNLQNLDGTYPDSSLVVEDSEFGQVEKIQNYPGVVSYYQQRLLLANTISNPETVYTSQTGKFHNFTFSTPTQDDDAVTYNLAGRQVNAVRHLVDLSKLLSFTQSGEWTVEGDDAGVLRPGFVNPIQHSYNGASTIPPVVINGSAIYIQSRGSALRDISFDFQIDGYRGNDITIFSNHLFDGFSIVDAAYQQIPHSILWCARSDGTLLGMTYIKEQQIIGWHRHDFSGGFVENVCCVPEGDEDFLYLSIKRTLNGKEVRYIERMSSRLLTSSSDVKEMTILDSFSTYDGTLYSGLAQKQVSGITLTLSGGSAWDVSETLTLTASSALFVSSDVGNEFQLVASDGSLLRLKVINYSSSTVVSVRAEKDVVSQCRSLPFSNWIRAVKTVSGLWHLEGQSVSVFADGFVVASPNNPSYNLVNVSNGSISLNRPFGIIHVGLPITSDVQTLNVDTAQGETISQKLKLVDRVSITLEKSRGLWAGGEEPNGDDLLDGLTELKIRDVENYDESVELFTGVQTISIRPEWKSTGSVFLRQVDPVPVSILGVSAIGLFPFRGPGG